MGKPCDPKPIGTTMEGKPTELYPAMMAGCSRVELTKVGSSIFPVGLLMGAAKLD